MPIYDYKCNKCSREEEWFLPVNRRNEMRVCGKRIKSNDGKAKICNGKMILQVSKGTRFWFK